MWKWLVKLVKSFFPKDTIKQLPPTRNNDIIVSEPIVSKYDGLVVKSEILKSYKSNKKTKPNIQEHCDYILEKIIPKEYDYALKKNMTWVILPHAYFKYDTNILNACYPVLAKELAKIGITQISIQYKNIFISTNNITQSAAKWNKL